VEIVKIVTGSQMRQVELACFGDQIGMRADIMMAYAGRSLADAVLQKFSDDLNGKKIAAVCGHGNNGGDGFIASYLIAAAGMDITVFFDGENIGRLSESSRYYFDLCNKLEIIKSIPSDLKDYDGIIDCILGTGFRGVLDDRMSALINMINASGAFVISADIPSGLTPDGIISSSLSVKADMTVTMGYPKINLMTYPGRNYAGEIFVADIGIPKCIEKTLELTTGLIDDSSLARIRSHHNDPEIHKYQKGHLLIIGGNEGFEGAAIMAAGSALATGVGLVSIASRKESRKIIAGVIPEVITIELPENHDDIESWFVSLISQRKINSVLIGPGLGRTKQSEDVFKAVAKCSDSGHIYRVIADADALYFMSNLTWKPKNPKSIIITPHIGEAARLLGKDSTVVRNNLFESAKELFHKYGVHTILKGASTIVVSSRGEGILPGGDPSLATGGTGDILAGICGAFSLRKDCDEFAIATASVCVHAMTAQIAKQKLKTDNIKATDLLTFLRESLSGSNFH
jgi:NAD(P)H-hydrate epimerase